MSIFGQNVIKRGSCLGNFIFETTLWPNQSSCSLKCTCSSMLSGDMLDSPSWAGPWRPPRGTSAHTRMGGARRRAAASPAQLVRMFLDVAEQVVLIITWLMSKREKRGSAKKKKERKRKKTITAFRSERKRAASWAKCRAGWNAWNTCFSFSTSSSG